MQDKLKVFTSYVETIVGVNKHRLDHEDPIDVLVIDNTKVRESQIQKIKHLRESRDANKVLYLSQKIGMECILYVTVTSP